MKDHLCEIKDGKFYCSAKTRGGQKHCGKKKMDKFDDHCQFMNEFTLECNLGKELMPEPQIGPSKKKMPDKDVCIFCKVVITKKVGGTKLYPKVKRKRYCSHEDLKKAGCEVSYIKDFPYTPIWCPVWVAQKLKGIRNE